MADPVVDDGSRVVEVVRQGTPREEQLTMDLQEKEDPAVDPFPFEEKKEEYPDIVANVEEPSLIDDDEPVEEGQEALWVDDETDLPSFVKPPQDEPSPAGTPPRSPKKKKGKNRSPRSPWSRSKNKHRVFLLPQEPTKKPSPLETVQIEKKDHLGAKKQLEAAQKVETARKLLTQALSPHANVGSRDLLAQAAFEQATEARRLVEETTTPELEALLQDAKVKGQGEVAKVRQIQLQDGTSNSSPKSQKSEESQRIEDEHASTARNLLEFILPEVNISNLPPESKTAFGTSKSADEISTLGFDNTYVAKGGSKDFDLLSMSSLNEILDGPMDEDPNFPVLKHRILASPPGKETTPSTKKGSKKPGLFTGMFRSKNKVQNHQQESAPESKQESLPEKDTPPPGNQKKNPPRAKSASRWSLRKSPEKKGDIEKASIVTKILIDQGPTHPDGTEETVPEITNLEELEEIKAIDGNLNKLLKEAIENDDTESLTSFHGVPLHGQEEKQDKDDKKGKGKRKSRRDKTEAEDIPPSKPRNFDQMQPSFVAAAKGDSAILNQKSWESLMSSSMESEKLPTISKSFEEAPADLDTSGLELIRSSSSSPDSTMVDANGDRYTITSGNQSGDDRYTVLNDESSFEAYWNPCEPEQLTIVPAATCSTIGMAVASVCLDPAYEPKEDETPNTHTDKYSPVPSDHVKENNVAENIEAPKPEELVQPPVMSAGVENRMAKPVDQTSSQKKIRSPAKKMKLKTPAVVAGLFGRQKAKSPSKPRRVTPTKTGKDAVPKSKRSTPSKSKVRTHERKKEATTENKEPQAPLQQPDATTSTSEEPEEVNLAEETSSQVAGKSGAIVSENPVTTERVDGDQFSLVLHIKEQKHRHSDRRLDPTTDDDDKGERRGVDP